MLSSSAGPLIAVPSATLITPEIRERIARHREEAIARNRLRVAAAGPPAVSNSHVLSGGPSTVQAPPPSAAAVASAANTALTTACRRRRSATPLDAVRQTHVELDLFKPSLKFVGAFLGFIFTAGPLGVGYYRD